MHIAAHLRGLKPKFPLLWHHQMLSKLQCLHSDSYTDHLLCFNWSKRKAKPDTDVWHPVIEISRAGLTHVGTLCRLIIWRHFNLTFLVLFVLGQDWQTFLRTCAQISDNIAVKFFHMWKHEFTGTILIFPVIPMIS